MLAVLWSPPDDHRDPASAPPNSFGFRECSGQVGCMLEGVEACYHIKACLRIGKLFHFSDTQVPIRDTFTRNFNECRGGVNPRHLGTELCGKLCRQSRSTADIQQPCAAADADSIKHTFLNSR